MAANNKAEKPRLEVVNIITEDVFYQTVVKHIENRASYQIMDLDEKQIRIHFSGSFKTS
ncbi:hypothetical protein [Pedobacter sp. JCM 36344]|uniref:hypothetical protein n=1 Tax=Pedobacter sp. JCM 36344 TaxID=3374280 RepID=UPI00397DC525